MRLLGRGRALRALGRVRSRGEAFLEHHGDPLAVPLRSVDRLSTTTVEVYWGEHTVNSSPFVSARQSLRYLDQRSREYPLFERLMGIRADHSRDVVVDYGCGPGNDLVNFAVRGRARRVIGIDVSARALSLARSRLALHGLDSSRAELIQVSDDEPVVPLEDGTVDYVYCEGVLHHTSHPLLILRELARILKPGGRADVMVYNRNSLWFHLYTAYTRQILESAFPGLSVDDAFQKNTDGEACPIARAYRPEEFLDVSSEAGFGAEFLGGYFHVLELRLLRATGDRAVRDARLDAEHREFLRELTLGPDGYPLHRGFYAGIGGVFRMSRQA